MNCFLSGAIVETEILLIEVTEKVKRFNASVSSLKARFKQLQ
jgi:hypothetical protein